MLTADLKASNLSNIRIPKELHLYFHFIKVIKWQLLEAFNDAFNQTQDHALQAEAPFCGTAYPYEFG